VARDYYAEADALAGKLVDRGYGTWAEQLTDAIAADATGTEIVMGLRWVLAEMLQKAGDLPADIQQQATGLHKGLDRILR
jgi:hypothetical protein